MVCNVPHIMAANVLVILTVLQVWFYVSLSNASEVGTVISFLQMKKLRHGGGWHG